MKVLIILAAALVQAQSPAERFDLVCTPDASRYPGRPALRVSVDLQAQAWCEQPCEAVRQISAIEPGMLIFDRLDRLDATGKPTLMFEVNRADGGYFRRDGLASPAFVTGQCERAPFTTLPARKF